MIFLSGDRVSENRLFTIVANNSIFDVPVDEGEYCEYDQMYIVLIV